MEFSPKHSLFVPENGLVATDGLISDILVQISSKVFGSSSSGIWLCWRENKKEEKVWNSSISVPFLDWEGNNNISLEIRLHITKNHSKALNPIAHFGFCSIFCRKNSSRFEIPFLHSSHFFYLTSLYSFKIWELITASSFKKKEERFPLATWRFTAF